MKRIIFVTFIAVLGIFAFTMNLSSCQHDACKTRNVVCQNNGTCKDGDCLCALGYEGDSCQFKVNAKFDSYYACLARTRLINDTVPEDNDDTLRVIASTSDRFAVTFYSIRDSITERINANVNGNYLTIKDQNIEFPNNEVYKYSGTGSLNNGVLTITLFKEKISPVADWHSKTTYVAYKYQL